MRYSISLSRRLFALLLTPPVAAVGPALFLPLCAYIVSLLTHSPITRTAPLSWHMLFEAVGLGLSAIALVWFFGLIVAPFSWLYALIVQWPLTTARARSGMPDLGLYLATSVAAGAVLFVLTFGVLLQVMDGRPTVFNEPVDPKPWATSPLETLSLFAAAGGSGGLTTGLFWWWFVVKPARAFTSPIS